jgi:tRNA A-37 threonylcarbamoyl transferase component Bud32
MIDHVKSIIDFKDLFDILNISGDTSFNMKIPFKNTTYNGRPDAIIVLKGAVEMGRHNQLRIMFDFKTQNSINSNSTQDKLELLGANICSWHPVLLVVTDLITQIRLLVCRNNIIIEAFIENDLMVGFEFISYWLHHICIKDFVHWSDIKIPKLKEFMIPLQNCKCIAKEIYLKYEQTNIEYIRDNHPKISTKIEDIDADDEKNFKFTIKQIEYAFRYNNKGKIGIPGRSGKVYKIEIFGTNYALKLYCDNNINPEILKEMENEAKIYQHLNSNRSDFWPKLFFAGYLFSDAYYGICTNFISGDCHSSNSEKFDDKIKQKCINALNELHKNDIIHGDIRFSNFIIKDNSAVIIDFGFSQFSSDRHKKENEIGLLTSSFR